MVNGETAKQSDGQTANDEQTAILFLPFYYTGSLP
jgi:hypothetical protein